MKSIYSLPILQSILDHWGVGTIQDVTYFQNIGRNVWRHFIETNQGEFELYSYPTETREYSEKKLSEFLETMHGRELKKIVHSFDRYHVLHLRSKKQAISHKQANTDLKLLVGMRIMKAFRVYGSIFQMHLEVADVNGASVLVSYGRWNIQNNSSKKPTVLVDTTTSSKDELDKAIEQLEKSQPAILSYTLKDNWFKLMLSNDMSLHFMREGRFPAIEVHLKKRSNDLHIVSETEIYYTKDL